MDFIRKNLFQSGVALLGLLGLFLFFKYLLHHHNAIQFEKAGKGIDEKLHESMVALDKATANVQQIFESLKGSKA